MSQIRYIVVSDVHFGAYNSLLTNIEEVPGATPSKRFPVNALKTSPALKNLMESLKKIVTSVNKIGKPPQFILLGDILELALGGMNDAAMTFERFLECAYTTAKPIFSDQLLYIPGNHDHHLWETAREKQYVDYIAALKPRDHIADSWHTTKMVEPDFILSDLLTGILRRNPRLKQAKALIAYPNYEIRTKSSGKSIILSHGNFLENIYSLMSSIQRVLLPEMDAVTKSKAPATFWVKLKNKFPFQSKPEPNKPESIYDLERENFAWIDFFWSTLGRSGKVGKGIGLVYDMLQDSKAVGRLSANVSEYLLRNLSILPFLKSLVRHALSFFLQRIILKVGQSERGMSDEVLSQEVIQNLDVYLDTVLPYQWGLETKREFPKEYSFIFGHTHKPFESYSRDLGLDKRSARIYNTGGWVVDTIKEMRSHGGAILLIDEEMNIVSFHAYKESDLKPSFHRLKDDANPLYDSLIQKVDLSSGIFKKLSESFHKEIELRRKMLKTRVDE
ncbi:hypothetical protein LEP1GSC058_2678 [Leptospira fainei serovar Hurstbridge str. BUT 6]|uniref:Calcineurin-like phosphoesterase domain-containing protein n=1 Tax=Leptospira fainei serovar Hurstbridge str. BUT 6 TaxID=1193011 RepID=S3UV67_9LEPT|nr:metallophosphoesterase [Leptospira fainei]EPG73143.1 hypothetical protein LEP1GSC058_2678 [Leptospira fainei serovar Hurstbridge str. BUT 6]